MARYFPLTTAALALCICFSATGFCQVEQLSNGNFEATPFDTDWNNSDRDDETGELGTQIFSQGGLTAGSTQAAVITASDVSLHQDFGSVSGPDWEVDFFLAATQVSGLTASRSFNVVLEQDVDGSPISGTFLNIRVNPFGDVEVFSGGWNNVFTSAFSFSTDANGDGDFDDPGDTLNVHRMHITANDFDTETRTFDLGLSNAGSTNASDNLAAGLSFFQNPVDPTGGLGGLVFQTGFGFEPGDFMVVDDVSVIATSGALAGDYNGDNVVNAADYTVWRDTLGSMTDLAADGDGSGTIAAPDYDVWKDNFGNSAGAGLVSAGLVGAGELGATAVPEPSTLVLVALCGLACLLRSSRV